MIKRILTPIVIVAAASMGFAQTQGDLFITGRLGIGTTSPAYALHIKAPSIGLGTGMSIENTSSTGRWDILAGKASGITVPNGLFFFYNNVGRMLIGPTGELVINTTTPRAGFKLTVAGDAWVDRLFIQRSYGGYGNHICSSGLGTGNIGNCSSSRRYKQDITPISQIDWRRLYALQPVSFKWNSDSRPDVGYIAEDVATVMPEIVGFKDGQAENVEYDRLPIFLAAGLQELDQRVDHLRAKNADLERRIQQLEELLKKQ